MGGSPIARAVAGALALAAAVIGNAGAAEPPMTECDQLAAHPSDTQRVGPGVQIDLMDWRNAIRACGDALKTYPNTARFQYQLGRALMRGDRRDEALPYLVQAADNGHLAAFANIGNLYAVGLRNPSEGARWLKRGVDRGDDVSRLVLGEMHIDGAFGEKNYAEGVKLLSPLADKGSSLAIYKIGMVYLLGDNTIGRDYSKALQWLQRAAGLGVARAQNDIGYMVENGLGLDKDVRRAADWYRAAAEQGWGKSQVNLGLLYENGRGVQRDLAEALYWYRLATDSSQEEDRAAARQRMDTLRKRLEPAQIAAVDARVNTWRKLQPQESVAILPPPVDPGYKPPAAVASVDQSYKPPGAVAPAGVDQSYKPPQSQGTASAQPPKPIVIEPVKGRYVLAGNANVRLSPDASSAQLGRLAAGQDVTVVGRVAGENWYQVMHEGKQAYVAGSLIKEAPAALPAATQLAAAPPAAILPAAAPPAAAPPAKPPAVTQAALSEDGKATLPPANEAAAGIIDFGRYHALVIGNSGYQHLLGLKTPKADSDSVAEILRRDFGFQVTQLRDATRGDIITALAKYRATLKWDDNLLIYYAGHGIVDDVTQRGYWLPVDAEEKVPTNWISTADISDMVRAIEAKHVMVVADACYSGTLLRDAAARMDTMRDKAVWLKRVSGKRARTVLSSGGIEPVLDSGGGAHSVFANAFINALKDSGEMIDAMSLFEQVRRPVVLNSDQTPQYADMRNAGHDGGEFVFIRVNKAAN